MDLKEFIKMFAFRDDLVKVVLEWFWIDMGIDEEYCFEGSPSEFVDWYTNEYDCIDGYNVEDCTQIIISNVGCHTNIYIQIVEE